MATSHRNIDQVGARQPATNKNKETRDGLHQAVKIIEKISDASGFLAPLKATCGVVGIFLETTRVRAIILLNQRLIRDIQAIQENAEGWNELKELLDAQLVQLRKKQEEIDTNRTEEQSSFIEILDIYVESVSVE